MKKIVNDVNNVEEEMIQGLVKSAPKKLRKLDYGTIVVRADKKEDKVALVSGGGSGHEPAHAGYVGTGMLDCAVAGTVFTSPTPDQVLEGIKAVATDKGVLCVVKNYTGDVMNFEMAIEMAADEDIKADYVVVNDDVAVRDSLYTTGRRGVAGTIFVHKIAGAKAKQGAELPEVKAVAEKVIANVRSMGMAIEPCTVPAAGKPGFELADDEMEIGIGIHGEPGTHREKMRPANEIAKMLVDQILADLDYKGHEVVVLINGMGGTPLMELYIVNNFVQDYLKEQGISVYDTMVGNYMTSIEMAGFSITLLRLDDEMKALYDAPADTLAWKKSERMSSLDTKQMAALVEGMAKKIEAEKEYLTELDNEIGDGDHGINLARGFEAVEKKLPSLAGGDIGALLKGVGMQLVSTVGGASGPLYGTAFMKAGMACKGLTEIDGPAFVKAMEAAVDGIKMRGKATEGEKTMLDALCPALKVLQDDVAAGKSLKEALQDAAQAAEKGVEYTKTIIATKGRASYLGERSLGHQDPGATSSLYLLQVLAEMA